MLAQPPRTLRDIRPRLDAVEDLMNNPAFEEEFTTLAKGLPDLERIVSRIHAKSCKTKDFLHSLKVTSEGIRYVVQLMNTAAQSFKKLSRGLKTLEKSAEGFESKNILGLLRSAPDLMPNIKHVEEMFVLAEKEKGSGTNLCAYLRATIVMPKHPRP